MNKYKSNSISFWRIVFTIMVVVVHCGSVCGAYLSVEFFFLVSGFLFAKSVYSGRQKTLKDFVKNRLLRLYPMYLFSMLAYISLSELVNYTISTFNARLFFNGVIDGIIDHWKSLFMLQLFGAGATDINVPAWYVVVLFWLTILFYILMKVMPKKVFNIFIGVSSVAMFVLMFIFVGHLDLCKEVTLGISQGFFRGYAEIGIGIILYQFKEILDKRIEEKKITIKPLYIILVELVGYGTMLITSIFINHTRWDYPLFILMIISVYASFMEHKKGFFCNKVVETISGFTYSVFLNHSIFLVLLVICGVPFENYTQLTKFGWVIATAIVFGVIAELVLRKVIKAFKKVRPKAIYYGISMTFVSFAWIYSLKDIKGSLLTYVIIAILSVVASAYGQGYWIERKGVHVCVILISVVLSSFVALGNYDIYMDYDGMAGYLFVALTIVSGFIIFYYIFKFGYVKLKDYRFKSSSKYKIPVIYLVIGASLIYIVLNVLILILCKYPGDIFYDTVWQLDEIKTGEYTNHHAVYHTFLLGVFVKLGYATGIGIAKALFVYTICQIIVVGLIVGYYIKTLYEMRAPIIILVLTHAFILLNPISLKYATYIDKDQLYVYMALLFLLALTRMILGIGNAKRRDWGYMIIGGLGFGLFRGNGFVILLATMVAAIIMKSEVRKKLMIAFASMAAVVFILNTPVRNAMGVEPSEFSESLSIPIQQVSRVVYDGYELTDEEKDMVFKLVEEDVIKEQYKPYISDNMKGRIQFFGRDDYFKENIIDYAKLYIKLGLRYPTEYVKAWVDQTYGYYTPGYGNTGLYFGPYEPINNMWVDLTYEIENDRKIIAPRLVDFLNDYAKLFEDNSLLYQFLEIGGRVYLILYMFIIKIWKRNKTLFIETAGLVTILTLLMASPLCTSIRYTYLIFLSVYLSIATTFYKKNEEGTKDILNVKLKEGE